MKTLKHGELEQQFPEAAEELQEKFDNLEGVTVTVDENYKKEVVELTVGQKSLVLTIDQARNLAKHIRMAANRLEKNMRARGVKNKKK